LEGPLVYEVRDGVCQSVTGVVASQNNVTVARFESEPDHARFSWCWSSRCAPSGVRGLTTHSRPTEWGETHVNRRPTRHQK